MCGEGRGFKYFHILWVHCGSKLKVPIYSQIEWLKCIKNIQTWKKTKKKVFIVIFLHLLVSTLFRTVSIGKHSSVSCDFKQISLYSKSGIHFYRSFHQRQKAIQWQSCSAVHFCLFIISHTCFGRVQLGEESLCRNSHPLPGPPPNTQ